MEEGSAYRQGVSVYPSDRHYFNRGKHHDTYAEGDMGKDIGELTKRRRYEAKRDKDN